LLPDRAEIFEQGGYLPRLGLRRWLQALERSVDEQIGLFIISLSNGTRLNNSRWWISSWRYTAYRARPSC